MHHHTSALYVIPCQGHRIGRPATLLISGQYVYVFLPEDQQPTGEDHFTTNEGRFRSKTKSKKRSKFQIFKFDVGCYQVHFCTAAGTVVNNLEPAGSDGFMILIVCLPDTVHAIHAAHALLRLFGTHMHTQCTDKTKQKTTAQPKRGIYDADRDWSPNHAPAVEG